MSAVDVHAVVCGQGPVVVLSNSLCSTHRMWDAQIADLEQRFTVVRYDTRGHGDSPVPDGPYCIDDLTDDAVALLNRLGIERAHVVGLSLGGTTAMRLAIRNPERVDRIALLCTAAELGPANAWTDRAATVRAQAPMTRPPRRPSSPRSPQVSPTRACSSSTMPLTWSMPSSPASSPPPSPNTLSSHDTEQDGRLGRRSRRRHS
jgi:pimeloyl-ACP methyl ester carboxylesterase